MDQVIAGVGFIMRLPFAIVGAAFLLVWTLIVTLFVLVAWILITPIFWIVFMPFRLFSLPRRGGAEKLRRGLSQDIESWKRQVARFFTDLGSMWSRLGNWLVGNRD
jgi:hypothetical protein